MYTTFFRLAHAPFSISPDPRYLFMSERHREALAHLLYGVDAGGGVVLLTGDIGTGKTTICRCFLEQVPSDCNVAYIFNPKLTVTELLQSIREEFHIAPDKPDPGVKDDIDALNRFLLAAHADGRNNVLVIDEAQNLSPDVLEQLRLLTNLETSERKLLQIILIGQPELRPMLSRPELEQLAQRVVAHYHLTALSQDETASYIQHRLATAGLRTASPFQQPLMKRIYRLSAGVPRRINLLCDRALLGAYAKGTHEVDRTIVEEAANELFIHRRAAQTRPSRRWRSTLAFAAGAATVALAWFLSDGAWSKKPLPLQTPAVASNTPHAPAGTTASEVPAIPPESDGGLPVRWRSETDAIRQLGPYWGVSLEGGDPCETARAQRVRCHKSHGGIAELRQLDRPAMLKLYDQDHQPYYAMLAGLSGNAAILRTEGARRELNLVSLARYFRGEFVTLWRAPEGFESVVKMGDRGPAVDWFAAALARLDGTAPPAPDQPFAHTTLKQVRLFQQAHGLFVDGIVGPVTAMRINRAAGLDEPFLSDRERKE